LRTEKFHREEGVMSRIVLGLIVLVTMVTACSTEKTGGTETNKGLVAGGRAEVTAASGLRMRAKPDQKAPIVDVLSAGAGMTVLDPAGPEAVIEGKPGRWVRVRYGASEGWVFGGMIRPAEAMKVVGGNGTNVVTNEAWLLVPGKRAGLFVLGKPIPESAYSAYGKPDGVSPPSDSRDSGSTYWGVQGSKMNVKLHDGVAKENVFSVHISAQQFRFANGIGVGSTVEDLQAKFPGGKREEGMDVDWFYTISGAGFGISGGKVSVVVIDSGNTP